MSTVHNLKIHKKKRQYLRNNATKAEKILWQFLRNSQIGFKFRRQHSIGKYIVDFYCPELKLITEIDGDVHEFKKQREHDWIKEKELKKLGFNVVRYKNADIMNDAGRILNNLKKICGTLDVV